MKRVFLVDDERHAIDRITQIVKRDLSDGFEIVGHALSGREAIEKAAALAPDIILMDVRMPGVSGLEAIRAIRDRGATCAFILVTAFERFEIAREAVELGVVDYLLKPVEKERLAASLVTAAAVLDRHLEREQREMEQRDLVGQMRAFVEPAFLHGIMLGERFGPDLDRYLGALGITEPLAVVAAVSVLPTHGAPDPDGECRLIHDRFRATIRYKTPAMAGPLVSGHSLVLLPLKEAAACEEQVARLYQIITQNHETDLAKGNLRVGFGQARPIARADASWSEALTDLLGGHRLSGGMAQTGGAKPFDLDSAFVEALTEGAPERARLSLDAILAELKGRQELSMAERYRIISLLGSGYRRMARRGLIEPGAAFAMMDLEDLRQAGTGAALELGARARFATLMDIMERTPQWSPVVSKAVAYVKENYPKPLSLEQVGYQVGISPNRLSRLFCEETGQGFSDFLIEYRTEKAKEMLLIPGASIKQVSNACGYTDPNYFSRLFKKVTGVTPTAFANGGMEVGDGRN